MRLVVYGAGAIGGLVGARLAAAGREVVLIARGAHGEAIRRGGLVIESPQGREVYEIECVDEPSMAGISDSDVVLLGMKSQDTQAALDALRSVAGPSTAVACLQNGVENERAALRLFDRVYPVCVMCPAAHLEPGVVQQFSHPVPGLLDVGRYPSGTDEVSAFLAGAFVSAGFDSVDRPDVMRWKYCKLLLNLGNSLNALLEGAGGEEIHELANEEARACFEAAGIDYASPDEDRARRAGKLQLHPVGGAPRGGGSSWQSLKRGTGTIETDYLNGEIVLLGRTHGIPTPVNQLLQGLAYRAASTGAPPGAMEASELLALLERREPGE
jgi:2-dehydropantoate 2-reductase